MKTNNSAFKFKPSPRPKIDENPSLTLELPLEEHLEELRQRIFHVFWIILLLTCVAFIEVKFLVKFLELPVDDVKFFQGSPGEYFVSTVKIAFYTGLLLGSPFALLQIIMFILPGLTYRETKVVVPLLLTSLSLFILGLAFSYFVLVPAALNFLLNYSDGVLERFWSFDQYFEFILVLFYTTGLAFQIPVVQIILGLSNLVSAKQMLSAWRYVIIVSTIVGALLTPSTDPVTQLLLSLAVLMLYFFGLGVLFLIKN